jgi:SMODS and SLOG-associating 2TM effector domain 1/SMODS and SLOG-associating 2TM effector domain 3
MPAVKAVASKLSSHYQGLAKWAVRLGVAFAFVYALAGPLEPLRWTIQIGDFHPNLAALIAGGAFLIAFVVHGLRLFFKPESKWYSSRGLTEEIKSFVWRYVAGGAPFDKEKFGPAEADDRFSATLHSFLRKARKEHLSLPVPLVNNPLDYITKEMTQTRNASLNERRDTYAKYRILDQQGFYQRRTRRDQFWATFWNVGLILIELGFASAAGLHAFGVISLDFFGVAGTLAAAIAAWLQFSQYRALADLYGDMAFELGEFHRKCTRPAQPWDEEHWAKFVDTVENFLEAEHGAWRKLLDPDTTELLPV